MTQMVRKNNKNLPLFFFNMKIIESSWHIDRLNTLIKKSLSGNNGVVFLCLADISLSRSKGPNVLYVNIKNRVTSTMRYFVRVRGFVTFDLRREGSGYPRPLSIENELIE